jgi:hypothetical protein
LRCCGHYNEQNWDHVLPRDKSGRIFLDLDHKWVKPILQHLHHLSIASAATDSEPLVTPEKQFEGDDLVGYYATLDLFGLTKTFYLNGIMRQTPTVEQMPFGAIDPHEFVSKLAQVMTSCNWNAPWKMLYKSSRGSTLRPINNAAGIYLIQWYSSKRKALTMYMVGIQVLHEHFLLVRSQEVALKIQTCSYLQL